MNVCWRGSEGIIPEDHDMQPSVTPMKALNAAWRTKKASR